MSDEQAVELEHHSPVLFEYKGDHGDHLLGVPMRDVRLEDWETMEDAARELLATHGKRDDGLYKQVMKVSEARQVLKTGKAPKKADPEAPKTPKKGGKRKIQTDPDTFVTPAGTRTDADTLAPGQAIPPTDAPQGEGAAGFVKSDTGGSGETKEG